MDRTFLQADLYKNAELKTYTSISALSIAAGIPKKILALAKKRGCSGFYTNSTVNWKVAKEPFESMLNELEEVGADDIAYWKKEIAKKDVVLKQLQIKKLEQNLIEPEEVKQLLIELATKQSVEIKKIFGELPPKCAGKNEIDIGIVCKKYEEQLFQVLQSVIEKM